MGRKEGGRAHKAHGGDADDSPNPGTKKAMQPEIFVRKGSSARGAAEASDAPGAQSTEDFRKGMNKFPENNPSASDDAPEPEKRGGRTKRKARADGGSTPEDGESSAGPLNYDGSNTKGNSVKSDQKNSGGSNEDEGQKRGGRQHRAEGGRSAPHMMHGAGGGLGRLDKAKAYGGIKG